MKIQERNQILIGELFDVVPYNRLNKLNTYDILLGRSCRHKPNMVLYLSKKDEVNIPKVSYLIRLKGNGLSKEYKKKTTTLLFKNLENILVKHFNLNGDITNMKEKELNQIIIPKMNREFVDKQFDKIDEIEKEIRKLELQLIKQLIWNF